MLLLFILSVLDLCRYLDYEKLGIKTYCLSQYEEALQDLQNGTVAKAMFKLEK